MSLSTKPKLNKEKYANAVIYFSNHCNNKWLGSTKLNKLMYYFDFVSYRDTESSATGDVYKHLDKGPVPDAIDAVIESLKIENRLDVKEIPYKDGKTVNFIPLSEPDMSIFNRYERELLEKICSVFKNWPTNKIVDQTHFESPWLYSKPYETVDYEYAHDIDIIPAFSLSNAPAR